MVHCLFSISISISISIGIDSTDAVAVAVIVAGVACCSFDCSVLRYNSEDEDAIN